ncbi:MAG: PxKF domain-containing protein [Vicinamibacterales bacterium]
MTRGRLMSVAVASIVCAWNGLLVGAADTPGRRPDDRPRRLDAFPLSFVPNEGQAEPGVRFGGHGPGYTITLTDTEAILTLRSRTPSSAAPPAAGAVALRLRLAPAAPKQGIGGVDKLPGVANYYLGRDPARWRTGVATFARVRYEELYPGVDLVFYGNPSQPAFDFIVAPGADPSRIHLGFESGNRLEIDRDGNLVVQTAVAPVRFSKPIVYQDVKGERRTVAGEYMLAGGSTEVAFRLGEYDPDLPLVIDPTVLLPLPHLGGADVPVASYLPSSGSVDVAGGAIGPDGSFYVTGTTFADDFGTDLPVHPGRAAGQDLVVARIDHTGSMVLWATYLGGATRDAAGDLALGADGSTVVAGTSDSTDFPIAGQPAQAVKAASNDAVVARLGVNGELLASTFLGGGGSDQATGVDVDDMGSVYVTGATTSTNFPATAGAFQPIFAGAIDGFVTKLTPNLGLFAYSTYLGGGSTDFPRRIAVDGGGRAHIAGDTISANFPTLNPSQPANAGNQDTFVAKLNPGGSALVYSTYLGGLGTERAFAIAIDPATGDAIAAGDTSSGAPFPRDGVIPGAPPGNTDAYMARFSPAGELTVLDAVGGSGSDSFRAIDIDPSTGNVLLAGHTASPNLALVNPVQPRLNSTGMGLTFNPFLELLLGGPLFPVAVASGDVNNDGRTDVVFGFDGTDLPVIQFRNAPAGSDIGHIYEIVLPGLRDLAVSGNDVVAAGNGLQVLALDGDPSTLPDTEPFTYHRITASDRDVIAASTVDNEVWVLRDGNLRQIIRLPFLSDRATDIAGANLNGDEHPDLIVTVGGRIHTYISSFGQFIEFQTFDGFPSNVRLGVAPKDFGNRGLDDVFVSSDSGFGRMLLNGGDGFLEPAFTIPTGPGAGRPVILDSNGDGRLDVAGTDQNGNVLTFVNVQTTGFPGFRFVVEATRVGDFTGTFNSLATIPREGQTDALGVAGVLTYDINIRVVDAEGNVVLQSTLGSAGSDTVVGGRLDGSDVRLVGGTEQRSADGGFEIELPVFIGISIPPAEPPAGADVAIEKTASPDPATAGTDLTYTLTVTNAGPATAANVVLTEFVPVGAIVRSITPSRGTCDTTVELSFDCQLGNMAPGEVATVTVVVTPTTVGPLSNTATVTSTTPDPNAGNNAATITTTVMRREEADLAVVKAGAPDPVAVGDDLTYTLTVTNGGPDTARNVVLTESIPQQTVVVTIQASQGSCDLPPAATAITCHLGDLAPGATATVTIVVTPTEAGTIANSVDVNSDTFDPNTGNNSATDTTTVRPRRADLSITKIARPATVIVGDDLTYTLTIANAGEDTATNVVVTEDLPAPIVVVTIQASQGSCDLPPGATAITCRLGDLAAGATATVTIVVTPTEPGLIVNSASVASDTFDPSTGNNFATAGNTVRARVADLSIEKGRAFDSGPLFIGQTLFYFIRVTNLGVAPAENVVVTDTLPEGVVFGGYVASEIVVCDESPSGVVTCTLPFLAAGSSVLINLEVITHVSGTVTNTAEVTSDTPDTNTANNFATHRLRIFGATDLAVTKTASPDPVLLGDNLTYTLTVTNLGPEEALEVSLTDILPVGVTLVDNGITASQGDCSRQADSFTIACELGNLAVGTSATVAIVVRADALGALTNTATVSGLNPEINTANNFALVESTVAATIDLSIVKTASPESVVVNDDLTYTLTVTNAGPRAANDVRVSDDLPPGMSHVSTTSSQGNCSGTGLIVCNLGTLTSGGSATVTIVVRPTIPGTIDNIATTSSDTPESNTANNTARALTSVLAGADLSIEKAASPDPVLAGATVTYTLTVTNNGPAAAVNVVVTESVPVGAIVRSITTSQGVCDTTVEASFACRLGDMAAGASATITVVVTPTLDGPMHNTATVASDTVDQNAGNNSAMVTTTVLPGADVELVEKTTNNTSPVALNELMSHIIVVRNNGPDTATGVVVEDPIPGGLHFVSASYSVDSGPAAACPLPCVVGDLPSGATLVVTVVVITEHPGIITNTARVVAGNDITPGNNVGSLTISVSDSTQRDYTFGGFSRPVENPPAVNVVRAGRSVPLEWRLTDDAGQPVDDPSHFLSFTSARAACGDTLPLENPIEGTSPGASGLQYVGDGIWKIVWKTQAAHAGECRVLSLHLNDDSVHYAFFRFR